MTPVQCQRLESAHDIIRSHKRAIEDLKVKLKRLESATDIKFFDTGNCENGVLVSKDDFPLFEKIHTAADTAIRAQWSEHQKAIDTFPVNYVEMGTAQPTMGGK